MEQVKSYSLPFDKTNLISQYWWDILDAFPFNSDIKTATFRAKTLLVNMLMY